MEQEKKLQIFLIKKFIIILLVVSIVENVILWLLNHFLMPVVLEAFFPEYEKLELLNGTTLIAFVVLVLGAFLVSILEIVIPEQARQPMRWLYGYLERQSGTTEVIPNGNAMVGSLSGIRQLMFFLILFAVFVLIVTPYIIGAIYFARITVREFERLADARVEERKDFERRRNLMLSDIAHDLRTPITTVAGYARALSDGMVSEDKRKEYLDAIQTKSARMDDLIQLLFDYVKLDSEGFSLSRQELDICELVRECGALQYSDAEAAGIEILADIPEERLILTADKIQLARVVTNLITNAIKHNDRGDTIGLFVEREEEQILVMVADTGRRIPDGQADHLFEPFAMGDESRNSRGGSGLGLSIAKKIVEMHGYTLRLIQQPEIAKYKKAERYVKMFMIAIPWEE